MRSPTVMRLEAKRLEKVLRRGRGGAGAGGDYLLASGFSAVDVALGYGALIGRRFVRFDALPNARGLAGADQQARPAYRAGRRRATAAAEIYDAGFL